MDQLLTGFFFAFGLVIGSFLNVVILRYNTGKSIQGRSACFSCGNTLRAHHLIPLFSFLFQRGRCAFCSSKISWQYPVVELCMGLLFMFSSVVFGGIGLVLLALILVATSLCVVIFVYDLRHKIIPDGIVFSFMALGFIMLLLRHSAPLNTTAMLVNLISAFGVFFFFFALWFLSKGSWMGFGDAKLAFAIGLFLPWSDNISAIVFSFWFGAVFGLALMAYERLMHRHRTHSLQSELPFAPFMIIAFFLVLFTSLNVMELFTL